LEGSIDMYNLDNLERNEALLRQGKIDAKKTFAVT